MQERLVRCTAPAEVMYSLQQEQLSFPTANTTTGAVGKVHRFPTAPAGLPPIYTIFLPRATVYPRRSSIVGS